MTRFRSDSPLADASAITRWLSERDPARAVAMTDDEFDALRVRLATSPGAALREPVRRRRIGWTIGGATAALLIAVAAPAVAFTMFEAQTGDIVPEGDTENSPGNELVDLRSEDIAQYAHSIFPQDLPVPDGVDIEDLRDYETGRVLEKAEGYISDPGVLVGDQTIVEEFALGAWCLWAEELESAAENGDAARETRAREVIVSAPQWEAVAEPGATFNGTSLQGFFRVAAKNAQSGATSVERFVAGYSGFSCSLHADLDFYRNR